MRLIDVDLLDLPVERLEFIKRLAAEEPEDFDEWEREVIRLSYCKKEYELLDFLLGGGKRAIAIVDEAIHRSRGQLTLF